MICWNLSEKINETLGRITKLHFPSTPHSKHVWQTANTRTEGNQVIMKIVINQAQSIAIKIYSKVTSSRTQ